MVTNLQLYSFLMDLGLTHIDFLTTVLGTGGGSNFVRICWRICLYLGLTMAVCTGIPICELTLR
jgi:hypothetical protein